MSEASRENPAGLDDDPDRGEEIADVQEQLDDQADGDGLAAEAGSGEEMGLSEG